MEFPKASFDKTTLVDGKLVRSYFPSHQYAPPSSSARPMSDHPTGRPTNEVDAINLPGQSARRKINLQRGAESAMLRKVIEGLASSGT